MKFSQLAVYFEKIEATSSRLKITQQLADLFGRLNEEEIDKTIYLFQGRLGPLFEKIDFGMAERLIIKAACSALSIERRFFENKFHQIGDLGKTIEEFKKQFPSLEKTDFSITEIYQHLLRLATAAGTGSQELKLNILADLIRRLDPLSARYLVRIPLGVMRMGFSDMTVLDALSWLIKGDKSLRAQIQAAYHVRPDLGFIAKTLKKSGITGLKKITPKIFTPIIMMRAERLSSGEEIIKKIGHCLIEPKYDGFRLQIHYQDKKVRLYSRSLEDVTYMYPDIVFSVEKEIKAKEIIFEGEAIGYNQKTNKFLPFQETVQRKRKFDIEEKAKEVPLKLFVFELLYLNGESYLNQHYLARRKKLETIIKSDKNIKDNNILLAPTELVTDAQKINTLFSKAVDQGLEGIVAKKINGIYQPGARGWNWIKFKKSYASKINDTIDCLIMGYDLGKGKRTGFGIGAFLVGVYDEKNDRFVTVAKIGTGLTDEEWKQLKVQSVKLKVKNKPNNYFVDKMMECDVWLEPAIVVEIRADEISKSPVHTAGLALRFPRLERFRQDKKPEETTTLKEIKEIFNHQKVMDSV
jgi:DNA ligase-1